MGSTRSNSGGVDLWSQVVASDEAEVEEQQQHQQENPQVAVIYRRRRTDDTQKEAQIKHPERRESRPSLAPNKRISWNRSLSTRGRSSISISADVEYQPQQRQKEVRRKPKRPPPVRKVPQPPSYEKEKAYFKEVDSMELLEESPSPKNIGTWVLGAQDDQFALPHVSTRLGKWLASKKFDLSYGPSGSLSNILENTVLHVESASITSSIGANEKTPERPPHKLTSHMFSNQKRVGSSTTDVKSVENHACSLGANMEIFNIADQASEDIGEAIKRLSLSPEPVLLDGHQHDPFATLLSVCHQSTPSLLIDVFSQYCDPGSIVKVGEGTYGEAFKAGATVCKIVPIDGDLRVNGEVQKRSAEVLEEVLLAQTLNRLRGQVDNACTTFIETIDLQVCQGSYDTALIRAWEEWDTKHGSENDHPREFSGKQCYIVFVLAHGGKDLESFVLQNFDEARSLMVQVVAALAVAEAAFEFEHRDLHWGNILLSRVDAASMPFTLEGRKMLVQTFGLSVSIIDFTLSRINTGDAIHFLDLSCDPELFEGPKGDRQAETYRKMKEIIEECWEGSFPKTNVLWLQYLVDILLLKKSFKRTSSDERDLRSLKKRLNNYSSAKEAISDPFFENLLIDNAT